MRETRLSGSVEGVMGNHDLYSDLFFVVRISMNGATPKKGFCKSGTDFFTPAQPVDMRPFLRNWPLHRTSSTAY